MSERFSATSKETTVKRRKKIFPSREAYQAWLEAREATIQLLRAHVARIDAELAAKHKQAG